MNLLTKVTSKQLAEKMEVSEATAKKLLRDVKTEYKIRIVTAYHVKKYLKVE